MRLSRMLSAVATFVTLAAASGCHGGGGDGGGSSVSVHATVSSAPTTTTPLTTTTVTTIVTVPTTLQCTVTNDSLEAISVVAVTPDQTLTVGVLQPGESASVDLSEFPSDVTFEATPVTPAPDGTYPVFPSATLTEGIDYTAADPAADVTWTQ